MTNSRLNAWIEAVKNVAAKNRTRACTGSGSSDRGFECTPRGDTDSIGWDGTKAEITVKSFELLRIQSLDYEATQSVPRAVASSWSTRSCCISVRIVFSRLVFSTVCSLRVIGCFSLWTCLQVPGLHIISVITANRMWIFLNNFLADTYLRATSAGGVTRRYIAHARNTTAMPSDTRYIMPSNPTDILLSKTITCKLNGARKHVFATDGRGLD